MFFSNRGELEETKKKRDTLKEKLEVAEKSDEEAKSMLDDAMRVRADHETIIVKLNSELEDVRFNYDSTKTALDAAYKYAFLYASINTSTIKISHFW